MTLTTRNNGDTITPSFSNDFKNLLTGTMQDQNVKIQNNLELSAIGGITAPATGLSGVAIAGTGMGIGTYTYTVTFLCGGNDTNNWWGESNASPSTNVTTTSGNQQASLTSIPIGPTGTVGRRIYRTAVGGGFSYFLHQINDNVTTTYTDAIADASINTGPGHPTVSTFGGALRAQTIEMTGAKPNFMSQQGWFSFQSINVGTRTQLAEITNLGNIIISGNNYGTTGGSIGTGTGKTFDSFDVGEVYECDQFYEQGTVVCPGPNNKMMLCTHDNCPCASVISHTPGLQLGQEDDHAEVYGQLVAMAGRVVVKTSYETMGYRVMVCSDGKGGVRPLYPDEPSYTIGFTLNSPSNGLVGIMLRPMYCTRS